ncbi:MAG: hypothetical protein WBB01_05140 [Phormidesmis sp.]
MDKQKERTKARTANPPITAERRAEGYILNESYGWVAIVTSPFGEN